MPREAPRLRRTLLYWLLLPLTLVFLSGAGAGYLVADDLANEVYNRELLKIAGELSLQITRRDGQIELNLPPAAQRLLLLDPDDKLAFRIATSDGAFIAGDDALPLPDGFTAGSKTPVFYSTDLHGAVVWIALTRAVATGPLGSSDLIVQVAETTVKRDTLTRNILLSIVLPQFLLIIVAGLLVWIGIAQGLLPLRRLRQAVEHRSHLDLSPIAEDNVPGEVRPLLHAVNELMLRLKEVLSLQSRFIADAAHQLRTPVAGVKTNIELALRETELPGMKRSLAQCSIGVERLSRLVSQLLSLARNEPNAIRRPSLDPIDLTRLAFNTTMEWVPEAYKRGIDLGFDGPEEPVTIEGDALRLAELINNLVDNAIRYSRENGRVTVSVARGPRPSLSVSDDGPRIPPEEYDRIFERFHRLLGTPTDGSGLGLAIVREIASIHRAEVSLTDDFDGIGNRFTVAFPAPPAPEGIEVARATAP